MTTDPLSVNDAASGGFEANQDFQQRKKLSFSQDTAQSAFLDQEPDCRKTSDIDMDDDLVQGMTDCTLQIFSELHGDPYENHFEQLMH